MTSKFTRRELMKHSLAAGAVAVMSGQRRASAATGYQVNLICSGMMAYFSHYKTGWLDILIPQPSMGATKVHEVRFGQIEGSLLPGSPSGSPAKYTLQLPGITATPGMKHPADTKNEFAFGYNAGYTLTQNSSGIYCIISIPMPSTMSVTNPRIISTQNGKPFYTSTFGTPPTNSIPEVVVLSFPDVNGPVTLTDSASWTMTFPPVADFLNLHLYSEPPVDTGVEVDHLGLFNSLFYQTDTLGVTSYPGVKRDMTSQPQPILQIGDPSLVVPTGMSRYDLATLSELGVQSTGFSNAGAAKRRKRFRANNEIPFVYSPADCVNGWAYGS